MGSATHAQTPNLNQENLELRLWEHVETQSEARSYAGFIAAFPESSLPAIQRLNRLGDVGTLSPGFETLTPAEKLELQRTLLRLGYEPGVADGVIGRRTVNALEAFQNDFGINISGVPNLRTLNLVYAVELELLGSTQIASINPPPVIPEAEMIMIDPEPMVEIDGDTRSIGNDNTPFSGILASRIFAGPSQYPPENFAAYGIVAFKNRNIGSEMPERDLMICRAYLRVLPEASELTVPITAQMVTVWPMSTDDKAREVAARPREEACTPALKDYGLVMGRDAIIHAKIANIDTSGRGPFLLAWSPADQKGQPDAPVLAVDMSEVDSEELALKIFNAWANEIEKDPDLWVLGWQNESLRAKLTSLVAKYGKFFSVSNVFTN